MGNGGKRVEQLRARELRAEAWTLADIAAELSVAKSSVSRWVRDVDFEPNARRTARRRSPNRLQRVKQAEIERCRVDGLEGVGELSDREFLMAGLGLYAGDGSKTPGSARFANSNSLIVEFYCNWLRRFFDVDEERLRIQLYLHADLDLAAATQSWAAVTGIPAEQFTKAYRAVVDETRRHNRHVHGRCHVVYSSTRVHREIMGLLDALMSARVRPKLSQQTVECSLRSC